MNKMIFSLLLCVFIPVLSTTTVFAADAPVRIRLGYFEAGENPLHNGLRDEFKRQLDAMAPDDTEFVFVPEGYRSAAWNKDSCRIDAAQLAQVPTIDIMIAIGPWVVQDLLAAGYEGPIVGLRQLDPLADSLVDAKGRPVAPNLTVQDMPLKIEDDIAMLARLMPVKKLGVLIFPNSDAERDSLNSRIEAVGRQLGIEVFTAEGTDKYGTFAYFNALAALKEPVDALYLGPLWGLNITQINRFLKMLVDRGLPAFTWEGRFLVSRGAFATNYAYGLASESRFQADKTLRIARGEKPADLPTAFRGGSALAINEATAAACKLDVPAEALISAELFRVSTPETADRYTLLDAVLRATQGNPGFLATYDRIDQAVAAAGEVASAYRPRLGLEAGAAYVDDNTRHNTVEPIANGQYRAGLVLDQQLLSLETLKAIRSEAKKKDLATLDQQQARLDLELAVTSAYLDHLKALEAYTIEHRYQEVVERNLELSAARFHLGDTGIVDEADMYRWQDERQSVINRLLQARDRVGVTRTTLNVLFNLPADLPMILVDTPAFTPQLTLDYDRLSPLAVKSDQRTRFENLLVGAARNGNLGLRTDDARIDLQRLELSRSRAGFYPSLSLQARFNLADELTDNNGVIDERTDIWSVFGRMKWPLYQGGARHKERARLKARMSELEFERDNRSLALIGTVHAQVGSMVTQIAAVPRLARSKALAVQSMDLVGQGYEGGKRDIVSMLDSYRHAREVELADLNARYGYLQAMARLVHDIGWSSSQSSRNFYEEFHTRVGELMSR